MSVGKPRSYQWTLYLRQILFENRAVGLWHGHDRLCLSRALQLWRLSAATEGGSWKFAMQFAAPANSPVGPLQQAQLQLHASERRVWELEEENARLRCQVIEQAQLPPPTPTQPAPARQQQRAESARRRLEAALASQLHAEEARLAHASAALEALRRAVEEREEHLLRQQARQTADPADPADPCRSCRSLQIVRAFELPADRFPTVWTLRTVSPPSTQPRTHPHARSHARPCIHPPSVRPPGVEIARGGRGAARRARALPRTPLRATGVARAACTRARRRCAGAPRARAGRGGLRVCRGTGGAGGARRSGVAGLVTIKADMAGQREPSGGLAEADRSLGQPEACSEPARFRHRWRVKELHAQLIVLRGQSVEWVEGDLYGELAPVAAMTPGEHV